MTMIKRDVVNDTTEQVNQWLKTIEVMLKMIDNGQYYRTLKYETFQAYIDAEITAGKFVKVSDDGEAKTI